MKILITGGAGFQGSHLSEFLIKQGHEVTVLNTFSKEIEPNIADIAKEARIIYGSVTDRTIVDKSVRGQDVVFHLAANINVDQSLKDPLSFLEVNVMGTHHVLEAVRENHARMIYASTCEVYGDGHTLKEGELLDETAELSPNSPYAASKAAADRWCNAYHKSFGVNVTIVRPFNIYGERQKSGTFGALIPILVRKALKGETLTIYGEGTATRDYLNIDDLVQAYNLVLQHPELAGKAINFGSGINTSVKDIAEYIAQKLGANVEHGPARPGEVTRFPADISRAKELGFDPKVGIWEGIDRYIDWAKQQPMDK
jgi:dTDP-glucose 4,6-dehydratase